MCLKDDNEVEEITGEDIVYRKFIAAPFQIDRYITKYERSIVTIEVIYFKKLLLS